jgi:DNA-binding LytR/AlgR family response regulator
MKLTCLIVDDEPMARNLLKDYVGKVPYLSLVDVYANPLEAIKKLHEAPVDLLFLDIQMPEITGITFLKILQAKPIVILTTAYSQYALESYELDVVDYLLKPVTFERFLKAVDKAVQRKQSVTPATGTPTAPPNTATPPAEKQEYVFVKDGTKLIKVMLDEILYIEGMKDYVAIHTRQQRIVSLQRIKNLEDQLPPDRFFRIHHSYIVAIAALDTIHKQEVQIGNVLLPISDSYKKAFRDFIEQHKML